MQMENTDLDYLLANHMIPEEELKRVFKESYSASAEMDMTFLCFHEAYQCVADVVNENSIVIDLGCGYAAQSFYFTRCKQYIGVDLPMPACNKPDNKRFIPETRFRTDNSTFYIMSIQQFISDVLPSLNLDMDNIIAICSAVPDKEAQNLVQETFPFYYISYPGEQTYSTLREYNKDLEYE